ncbi:MAG: phage tail protein [Burkholderiaceae bacterium]|uniref:phage tail protein n=1 Tax=Paucibacter sp. KCTC 42545 TaxID=1768242 RepID=UPI000733A903|nr:phage tail protein [Paucibacter sp. KCTC 42545]ALT76859.1 hypothetical protein AT984_06295 [Paucibacter sp. KCTC 42545]MBY0236676.1 phage tail protein [Burkholderiaceae bacterium]
MATKPSAAKGSGPAASLQDLPVAFAFKVEFFGLPEAGSAVQSSFQEVSGLEQSLETEDVAEGGENRFIHQLPAAPKARRLKLKRGLIDRQSPFVKWCRKVLEGGLNEPIKLASVKVQLINAAGDPLLVWWCRNAYPVRWDIDPFNSTSNEAAIEQIELAYQYCSST